MDENIFRSYLETLVEKHIPLYFTDYAYLSQIMDAICDKEKMSKRELLILAYLIGADVKETNTLLQLNGYGRLYVKKREDAIWRFAIKNRMDVTTVIEKIFPQDEDENENAKDYY